MGSTQSEPECHPGSSGAPAAQGKSDLRKPKEAKTAQDSTAIRMQGQIAVSGRYHREPKKLEDDYVVDSKVLGSGFNGSVFMAYRKGMTKEASDKFAIKAFQTRGIDSDKRKELEQECEIFLSMDHPHVARLVDVYETKDNITLVMECMAGGELFDRVIDRKRFNEKDAAVAANQMLLAVNYLHAHEIVHRDIKLENWLYESHESDHLKLIDFGFSKVAAPDIRMKMSCGTLSYVAPEVLMKNYTSQCDMWSLGVVLFILVAGYMPFSGSDEKQVRCIKSGTFTWKEDKWATVSKSARDFVEKLMKVDPLARLTAEQALKHVWIMERDQVVALGEPAAINPTVLKDMVSYAQESKFRRACMITMAWSLSNEERSKLRDGFMAMDLNQQGTITLAEFKKVIEENYHLDDAQVEQVFGAIDAAHNGEIQYSEFLAAMVSSRMNLYGGFLETAFRRFDTDASGFISEENLRVILGNDVSDTDLAEAMKEVDSNHDGKISFKEFTDYVTNANTKETSKQGVLADRLIDQELRGDESSPVVAHAHARRQSMQAKGPGTSKTF